MRPTATLLCLLLATLVSASQTLPNVSKVTASSNTSQGNSYQSFRCQTGAEKPNAVINCLAVLAQMRSTPTDPRSFDFKRWQDEPNGCAITAIGVGEPRAMIDVRDLPNYLVFLLYRCFLTDRVTASSSAMIFAGPLPSYRLEINPPTQQSGSTRVGSAASYVRTPHLPSSVSVYRPDDTNGPSSLAVHMPSMRARPAVRCTRTIAEPAGAFTDCLAALLKMLDEPGSGIPLPWQSFDGQQWYSANCLIQISVISIYGDPDVFTERSLINEAVWMMGKCFAGPERSRSMNYAGVDVGPLRKWRLTLVWGMDLAEATIAAHAHSSVLAANDTAPLSPITTLDSPELNKTS